MDWPNSFRMSIPVDRENLIQTIEEFGASAYFITSSVDDYPHVTHSSFEISEDSLFIKLGRRSSKNAEQNSRISILWPPVESGGYNLIVDGTIERTDSEKWRVQFDSAILHRPAESPVQGTDNGCDSDCKPV